MGLTETVAPCFSNPLRPTQRRVGSVGRASGCEARVVDAALQPVTDGTTGEIVIRGPTMMRGHDKNDEATHTAFTPDGWLRSGDLGYRDAGGFFFVTGRIRELIIEGSESIAPREIDEALLKHPDVLDTTTVGIPVPLRAGQHGVHRPASGAVLQNRRCVSSARSGWAAPRRRGALRLSVWLRRGQNASSAARLRARSVRGR